MAGSNLINAYFAQGYGCEDYGETVAYNSCAPINGSNSSSSGLADTGVGIMVIVVLAAILIFVGVLIRFVRRSDKKLKDRTAGK